MKILIKKHFNHLVISTFLTLEENLKEVVFMHSCLLICPKGCRGFLLVGW